MTTFEGVLKVLKTKSDYQCMFQTDIYTPYKISIYIIELKFFLNSLHCNESHFILFQKCEQISHDTKCIPLQYEIEYTYITCT